MKKYWMRGLILSFLILVLAFNAWGGGGRDASGVTTIDLLLLGNRPTNGRHAAALERLNSITSERIGAVLSTRYIEWADWQNQYQLALAAQDPSLDLVITSTTWLYAWQITRRGGFYGMTPQMIQANAPRTWAEIPREHWDLVTEDGLIWFIPENQYSQYTNHGMYWRLDWARAGGLTSIDRFEDLERYWDIVKATQPQAVPWDVAGAEYADLGLFNGFFMGKRPVQNIIGAGTGFQFHNNDPYTVVSYYMDGNELNEAAALFHRWGEKGFWRDDVLNYRGETRNLMYAGLSGSDQHHTQTYIGIRVDMDREQPGSELQMYWWGKELNNVNRDLLTHGAMAINAASRNVELALRMYDLLRTDEQVYTLYNFGIEGVDYVVERPGVFAQPPGFNPLTDGLGANFWGGRVDRFEPAWAHWWSGRGAFIDHMNSFATDYPLERFNFDNTRVQSEQAALSDVFATFRPAIHYGKTPNPERAVADFRAALRQAGFDRVRAELQSQLTAARNRR